MSLALHEWVHTYTAPLALGGTITGGMNGRQIAQALTEIQDTINAIKIDEGDIAHEWTYPCSVPNKMDTITGTRPGQLYAQAITEIQGVINGMTGFGTSRLVDVWNEHRQCIGQGAYVEPEIPDGVEDVAETRYQWKYLYNIPLAGKTIRGTTPGFNIAQAITEIQDVISDYQLTTTGDQDTTMETWLERNCTSFINDISGPLAPGGASFLYFTLATWRIAAGIDGSWQEGDLVKGFNALKWLPLFGRILNVRGVFPTVTGKAAYQGSGSGPNFGVYYTYSGGRLGGSGTYDIILDTRDAYGAGGAFYISLGRSNAGYGFTTDGGILQLDVGGIADRTFLFSANITFNDSMVQVFGCRLATSSGAVSSTATYTSNSASVSAHLKSASEGVEDVATFEFFPVIKVPFTLAA